MTEDQIERRVEAMIDRLDREFLTVKSHIDIFAYDERIREIEAWADAQYRAAKESGK